MSQAANGIMPGQTADVQIGLCACEADGKAFVYDSAKSRNCNVIIYRYIYCG